MEPQTALTPPLSGSDERTSTPLQGSLEGFDDVQSIPTPAPVTPVPIKPQKSLVSRLAIPILVLAIAAVLGATVFAIFQRTQRMTPAQESNFSAQQIDLDSPDLTALTPSEGPASTLAVNGQLSVAGSLQVNPGQRPINPKAGQIYFDEERNSLGYYNGSEFVFIQGGSTPVQNIDNSTSTTVIVNNPTQLAPPAPPSVLLQKTSPGTAQNGNFNVNGTGIINTGIINTATIQAANITDADINNVSIKDVSITNATVDSAEIILAKLTQVDSEGGYFTINKYDEIPSGVNATVGYSNTTNVTYGAGLGYRGAKITTGSLGGPLQSIAIYIGSWTPGANYEIGLYTDNGAIPGKPGMLIESITGEADDDFVEGWNTIPLQNPPPLQPFTSYWVMVNIPGVWYDTNYTHAINYASKPISGAIGQNTSCSDPRDQFWTIFDGGMPDNPPCALGNAPLVTYLNYITDASTGGAGAMFSLSPTGQASFRNTEDSLNAFKIQNAASGTTIFNVDTYNMRVAIGKPSADYLLDIGNGDVNLMSGRSIRFDGTRVLTGTSSSTVLEGGLVSVQAGSSFQIQSAGGGSTYLTVGSGGANFATAASFSGTVTFNGTSTHVGSTTLTGATTASGAFTATNTFTSRLNSATAFRIQNTANTDLFLANTANMTITIGGTDTSFATLTLHNAHFKSTQTTAPTIAVPTNCGTDATATVTAGSTDSAGSFTITTGTDGTSDTCDTTITFHRPYGAAPKSIIVVGKGSAAAAQRALYVTSETTTSFSVSFANSAAGADETAYKFNYWIIE